MTDPEAAQIIDDLVVLLAFRQGEQSNPAAFERAIEYLMRTRREHPDWHYSTRLWTVMAEQGLIT